ncbi:SpaA isopeptide-forming pilin-related protein [Psychrobacillus lasiicapitis]|uniref:Adhesin n=1 Tax=Psychrobacillus lasiicapitis TaxID=1636719 RepID=A0A544TBM8_9BACI|nr:SpaA isopeptide-forming pilin-related protein [Psychrobacillus lasiicapitis]TQR14870.1 adhesin [Psychrobacillus lasiicapitis]GGA20614.1 hypothetical protein GCM10011384_07590 [Psychrobacillus lasiicapitis]
MRKISFVTLVFLLVLQSFMGPIAASANTETAPKQSFTFSEVTVGEDGKASIPWIFVAGNEETDVPYTHQTEFTLDQLVTGSLNGIGSYTISPEGLITVTVLAHQTQDANGTIEVVGIQQPTTQSNEQEPVEATPESDTTDEAVKDKETTEEVEKDSEKVEEVVEEVCEEQSNENEQTKCEPQLEEAVKTTNAPSVITENLLTGATLLYEDSNGNVVEKPSVDSIVSVKYTWALQNNHGYKAGSTFTFSLPPELIVYDAADNLPMKDGNGEIVGHFTFTKDGKATVTFTDYIEKRSNINGNLEVLTKLSKEIIVTEDKTITITPIAGGASITVPLDFTPGGPSVTKKGIPNRAYNAETIEWTIDFNKTLENVEKAILSDPIQDGQLLNEGSIKLYHLNTKLDGNVTLGSEVTSGFAVGKTAGGKDFTINFEGDIKSAYRLVYTTTLTNEDQTKFENKATLLSNGQNVGEAAASVTVNRGTALAKKAAKYDADSQTITWEIKYNYNEKNIPQKDALLKDFFNGSQELINDSFQVQEITINENGNESGSKDVSTGYTITPKTMDGKNGFEFQFNQGIQSAYKITYKTKATNRVFETEEIVNIVSSDDKQSTGKQTINQRILFKSNQNANYKNKTVDWTITFNHDRQEMKNVILTDVFTNKGLTLVPDTIIITTGSTTLTLGEDYKIIKNERDEFVIEFLKTLNTQHTIKYTTNFNYEQRADIQKNYLQNKATLTWKDKDDKDRTKEAVSDFKPDNYTQSNGFKNGSYNAVTQEITWNVGVNYNLKTLANAAIEDFIVGNQKVLKESLEVYQMSLTGGANGTKVEELIEGVDYSISWIKDMNNNPGFRIQFTKEINSPYMVTYKTSLKDLSFVEKEYKNTATFYNGSQKETDLSATVSIPNGGTYTTKNGAQNSKILNWSVNINFAQAKVSNATVTDMPSADQAILEDSIQVYATTIETNGNVKKAEPLVKGKDYELDFQESQRPYGFKISFNEEIDKPYILEYQSFILKAPASISNKVLFNGDHVKEDKKESSKVVEVKKTIGMGDGTGELGGLLITKTDATTKQVLEGAKFVLKDKDTGTIIKTGTTNDKGMVQFDKLLFGEYLLVETEAPVGYLKNNAEIPITIDKAYVAEDTVKTGNAVPVTNKKLVHAVQLEKVDSEDASNKLKGANFLLERKNGDNYETIGLLVTNEQGIIYKEELAPGEYRFTEQIAPAGYVKDDTPIPFSIKENQLAVIKLGPIKNEIIKGAVELKKVDKDNQKKTLEGAIFTLQDTNGNKLKEGLTTDENGKLTVNNLKPGKYQFVETKAPFGYKLDTTPISFTIVASQNTTLELTAQNEMILGSVSLTKVDEDDSKITLKGAIFELQDKEGNTLQSGLSTNAEGKIVVPNLKPGTYQFVETEAPDYYQLNTAPIPFNIEMGETTKTTMLMVPNKLIAGSVELSKVDKDDASQVVAGAEFALQDANGKTLLTELKTDTDGKLSVTKLKPGSYQFVETKAPFGYDLDQTPIKFTIEKSKSIADVKVAKVTAQNELSTGSVELTKVDKEDQTTTLEGAVFELQDANGNVIHTALTTNKDGKIVVSDLKPGNYQFVETKAPFGYDLDPTPVIFTIDKGQSEMLKISTKNSLTLGSVELIKVDSDNKEVTLADAQFKLLDAKGDLLKENLSTNAEGKLAVDDLKPGNYQFVETKAPFGYELNENPIEFTINIGQTEARSIEFPNTITKGSVELTKQDKDNNNAALADVEFTLQDEHGISIQEGLITDKDGKIIVDNLKPGNYQFIETKAPFGYKLDPTPIKFTIILGPTTVN